ncbi:MAG: HupE/UreJ family protein [Novosphingobium sp.]|nr:HupE/UreJ family protein [Novosphingobium sp.]
MADQEHNRQRTTDGSFETRGLQPKIMSESRGGGQDQTKSGNSDLHFYSLKPFVTEFYNNTLKISKQFYTIIEGFVSSIYSELRLSLKILCGFGLALVSAEPALAHEGTVLAGGFGAGFLHPLSGPDHMLAMIAVGLWGAILGRPLLVALPTLFPLAMAFGGVLGIVGMAIPPVEIGIAASVLVLGLMILFAVRAAVPVACAVVAGFALFHGYAHGQELPAATDPVSYSAGFMLATGLLHLAGIGLGMIRFASGGQVALRSAGGAISLAGIWFLAGAIAP